MLLSSYDGTGYVSLHRASDGMHLGSIGSSATGAVTNAAKFIDVNDANGEIHVMQAGPKVTVFSWSWIPG